MLRTNRFRHLVSLHKRSSTADGIGGRDDSWSTTADVVNWRVTIHSKSGVVSRQRFGDSEMYDAVLTGEPIAEVEEGDLVHHDPRVCDDQFIVQSVNRVSNERSQQRIVRCELLRRERRGTRRGQ